MNGPCADNMDLLELPTGSSTFQRDSQPNFRGRSLISHEVFVTFRLNMAFSGMGQPLRDVFRVDIGNTSVAEKKPGQGL